MNENTPEEQPPKVDATAMVPGLVRRYAVLAVVLALGVVLVGFLRGVREPSPLTRQATVVAISSPNEIPLANRYEQANQPAGQIIDRQRINQDMNIFGLLEISQKSRDHLNLRQRGPSPFIGGTVARSADKM